MKRESEMGNKEFLSHVEKQRRKNIRIVLTGFTVIALILLGLYVTVTEVYKYVTNSKKEPVQIEQIDTTNSEETQNPDIFKFN